MTRAYRSSALLRVGRFQRVGNAFVISALVSHVVDREPSFGFVVSGADQKPAPQRFCWPTTEWVLQPEAVSTITYRKAKHETESPRNSEQSFKQSTVAVFLRHQDRTLHVVNNVQHECSGDEPTKHPFLSRTDTQEHRVVGSVLDRRFGIIGFDERFGVLQTRSPGCVRRNSA